MLDKDKLFCVVTVGCGGLTKIKAIHFFNEIQCHLKNTFDNSVKVICFIDKDSTKTSMELLNVQNCNDTELQKFQQSCDNMARLLDELKTQHT